jgi:hypothetical protein
VQEERGALQEAEQERARVAALWEDRERQEEQRLLLEEARSLQEERKKEQ